jgi:HEAT repeat protein
MKDSDPGVRAAAVAGLGRLNDDGTYNGTAPTMNALTHALTDSDTGVQVAAIEAAGRVSVINDAAFVPQLTTLLGANDAIVRKHAVQLLDEMVVSASDAAVLALAKGDADEDVRIAACHALGAFRNPQDMATLQNIAANDSSSLVRDMASIALQRL